jgi:hypothetical protein
MRFSVLCSCFLFVLGCAGGVRKPAPSPSSSSPASPASIDELRLRLAEQRRLQIARLQAYVEAGEFPRRRVRREQPVDVLIDDDGHLSAIASLMEQAGEGPLIRLTAAHSNSVNLADVKAGPLLEWVLGSGLTREEVALLQMPYVYDSAAGVSAHFQRILARLSADTDASLDAAAEQLAARQARLARR